MRAVIVYESMFGSTRKIADAIGRGAAEYGEIVVVGVHQATPELVDTADLLVVGGPTHVHSMSRPASRRMAGDMARKPGSGLILQPDTTGDGLREWLAALGTVPVECAAFDTKLPGRALLTGRASTCIDRLLRHHGAHPLRPPHSFIVGKDNTITPDELSRAELWGGELARAARARTHA
jgi:hypothetical protein